MATNVEALKGLYTALGGSAEDVAGADTTVDVLNVISGKYEGQTNAGSNAEAIVNITDVADNIGGGGSGDCQVVKVGVHNSTTDSVILYGTFVSTSVSGDITNYMRTIPRQTFKTLDVVIYGNSCVLGVKDGLTFEISSGSAELLSDVEVSVTGECSLKIVVGD